MTIAIGADHGGFHLKEVIICHLKEQGKEVIDFGTYGCESCDYPDYAVPVCEAVLSGQADFGILICGTGIGMSIAANKVPGIYSALCHDTYSAHQGVEHDNMNVLCLGCRIIGSALAQEIVTAFVGARFESHEERHVRRHNKVLAIERAGIGAARG